MERTFQEKIHILEKQHIQKHPYFKLFYKIWYGFVKIIYTIWKYFYDNTKRFASIGAVLLFFCVSSSFASVSLPLGEEVSADLEPMDVGDSIVDYTEEAGQYDDYILDDSDVEYMDDEMDALGNEEEVGATYSLDDILQELKYDLEDHAGKRNVIEDYSDFKFDKNDWRLVLINKQHAIPEDYTFSLGYITDSMQCDERIIDDLLSMLAGARQDGVNLIVCSPYRDTERQIMLFNRKITAYMSRGMSYLEAYRKASLTVTVPGASEHQVGLAMDIITDTYTSLDTGFADTIAGKWLKEHSCEYGFILRYPLGKEYVTGIQFEPWHFRYVGVEAATVIMKNDLTLEEFVDGL